MKRTHLILTIALSFVFSNVLMAQKQKKKRPNILFCIADDASFSYFGAYGSDWVKTPAFDKYDQHGLLFNKAYTPHPKSGTSRAMLLTGRTY